MWDRKAGYVVPRDCYNSYFYAVEDTSLTILDKFKLHGKDYIKYLDGEQSPVISLRLTRRV